MEQYTVKKYNSYFHNKIHSRATVILDEQKWEAVKRELRNNAYKAP